MATICSYGAAGEVTGSCHLLALDGTRILLDCGLFQGGGKSEERNYQAFPFDPRQIDAVVLSHAHIDHSGRLPLLVRQGFRGAIYTHKATRDLCAVMLKDAAHLHLKDVESENRKRERKGLRALAPMYTLDDVDHTLKQMVAINYAESVSVSTDVRLQFADAGHILGSAIVRLTLQEGGKTTRLVFSGDLGPYNAPVLRDPATVAEADILLLESTYGDRDHRSFDDTLVELETIFTDERSAHGNIIIPAFAVGRSQEILYLMAKHFVEWKLHRWQIFLDSPMAIEATEIYFKHRGLHDAEAQRLLGADPGHSDHMRTERAEKLLQRLLPNLHFMRTPEQSQSINRLHSGAIIIAGSGMCNGGRVKHHLKHLIWRASTQVIMIGYQAMGTPGRRLVNGEKFIRLWGEAIRVNAKIHTIGGLSAHAGQADLLHWLDGFKPAPKIILVHGELLALQTLKATLSAQGKHVRISEFGQTMEL